MGLLNWIFDIYQHTKIHSASRDAAAVRAEMEAARHAGRHFDAARIERALGELALATRTVSRLLVEKGVCTSSEFQQMLDRIDAEDGAHDKRSPF